MFPIDEYVFSPPPPSPHIAIVRKILDIHGLDSLTELTIRGVPHSRQTLFDLLHCVSAVKSLALESCTTDVITALAKDLPERPLERLRIAHSTIEATALLKLYEAKIGGIACLTVECCTLTGSTKVAADEIVENIMNSPEGNARFSNNLTAGTHVGWTSLLGLW